MAEIYIDVDLDNFEDSDLVNELENRGYTINPPDFAYDPTMEEIFHAWNRGHREDALIFLERIFPQLRDISKIATK